MIRHPLFQCNTRGVTTVTRFMTTVAARPPARVRDAPPVGGSVGSVHTCVGSGFGSVRPSVPTRGS